MWAGPIILLVAVAVVVWIAHMVRWDRQEGAQARTVVWLLLACVLAGLLVSALAPSYRDRGAPGLMRTATVLVLTYAILRQQFLGFDVTARFAISRSTIAAIFIAVFFVASEAAQQFFGDRFESGYLGIASAGLLVFAMAPLSRVADRLAAKAVPHAFPVGRAGDREREQAYRSAVQMALRDRRLTRNEERDLFRLARTLGIDTEHAHEILAETEAGHGARVSADR